MKVIVTESQFSRVILKEEGREQGEPIKNLEIIQTDPDRWYEIALGYILKGIGYGDIIVTDDMGTSDVIRIIRQMSSDGKATKGPKVLYKNSLDSLYIGTHGKPNQAGCGKFRINDTNGMKFLKYLAPFTKPTTKVQFTGCYTGNDPFFVSRMATALGVDEVIAATDSYYPARDGFPFYDPVPAGYLISCPSMDKIKNKDFILPQKPDFGKSHRELDDEEIEKRIKQIGCKVLNS